MMAKLEEQKELWGAAAPPSAPSILLILSIWREMFILLTLQDKTDKTIIKSPGFSALFFTHFQAATLPPPSHHFSKGVA
jgi:hypothetical protein